MQVHTHMQVLIEKTLSGGMVSRRGRAPAGLAAALLAVALAGCGQTQATVSSAVRPVATATGFATTVPEPQDFVKSSRPKDMDYLPVGVTPPARDTKILTPEQLAAAEKDLEATRGNHDALSGRPPPKPKAPKTAPTKKQDEKIAPSL